jgi:hypothetical protein
MKCFKSAALGLSLIAFTSGGALAQDNMMKQDNMAKPMHMSTHDTMMMKKCQGMDHDMMMKNKSCKKMMKMHPDMMKDDSMMKH